MNNIISTVSPLTIGIIWFPKEGFSSADSSYQAIDYLLDGLLTASLNSSQDFSSQVLMGQNFNQSLHVLIVKKMISNELESYLNLLKGQLKSESDILVIDEKDAFNELKKHTPKDIQPRYRLL